MKQRTTILHVIKMAIGMMASQTVILIRLNFAELLIILLIRCVLEKKDDNTIEPPSNKNHNWTLQPTDNSCILALLRSKTVGIIDNEESMVPQIMKYRKKG
mmetsp:Transcript_50599/g.58477  ORF Transcript_50599/g.58477 Transcript_50599/m.58477 type:complete len:101 (-) Transcript_50599:780-1082(-)